MKNSPRRQRIKKIFTDLDLILTRKRMKNSPRNRTVRSQKLTAAFVSIIDSISNLPADEYLRIVEWFREQDEVRWDQQMDQDSASGKLDFLFKEAEEDTAHDLA